MSKDIKFNEEARAKILSGVNVLTNAVKITLGPKGRHVAIERPYGVPSITKDGVSVAKEIELKDRFENVGAQAVREVASKTADAAGDGTTTATILAQSILQEGIKNITAGANPMEIKRGIDKAVSHIVEKIKEKATPIKNQKEIEQIATISANSDTSIGELIAKAMEEVGKDGVITIEEAKGMTSELEVVKGMQFERGYLSPYFVTDKERAEAILENPAVLLCDKKISSIQDLMPVMELTAKRGKALLLVAEDVDGDALATLVVNSMRGTIKVVAVKAPEFGDRRKAMLQDIAILTDANVITDDFGKDLKSITVDDLGVAKKVIVSKDSCTIVNNDDYNKELFEDRVKEIKAQIENSDSAYDKEKLQERLAKLAGGVAVIKVGAPTETEMREKKDRVDDALHATRAAVAEGIVCGGGIALLREQASLDSFKLSGDQQIGVNIVKRALEEPARIIAQNAGHEGSIVIDRIKSHEVDFGFDAKNEVYIDLIEAGIIDPAKVTRSALQNAASVATLLLTTEAIVCNLEDEKKEVKANMPPMPGGMY